MIHNSNNTVNIVKPLNDDREYRYLYLPNGIKVVLCSDKVSEQAGASLSVNVGSICDGETLGIAHFLEHMLFLGTEKYPVEKEFMSFIRSNGGSYNGTTSSSKTNYFFRVNYGQLEKALDRFSSFFISPLFTKDAVGREVNAVQSEYMANLQNDVWRQYYTSITQLDEHPFTKFRVGSLETLKGDDLRDRVIQFYKKHYTASQMAVCIVGRESLDELEKYARQYFEPITNDTSVKGRDIVPLSVSKSIRLFTVPVAHIDTLNLVWPISDKDLCHYRTYRSGVGSYISHLIGHESKGSILSLLKSKNYAHSLMAGDTTEGVGLDYFNIQIQLTESGLENVDEVIGYIYQFIDLLDQTPTYSIEEKALLGEITWNNSQKTDSSVYAKFISDNLITYDDPRYILKGKSMNENLDINLIKKFKSLLSMDHMIITQSSKTYQPKAVLISKYYGVEYCKEEITQTDKDKWLSVPKSDQLYIPKPNPFIPKDFTIRSPQDQKVITPETIYNENSIKVDYAPDHQFNTPLTAIHIQCENPYILTCRYNVLAYLMKKAFKEVLNERVLYYAALCGTTIKFALTTNGNDFNCTGYNDKLIDIVYETFKQLNDMEISQLAFDRIQELLAMKYMNQNYEQPYSVASRVSSLYLGNSVYPASTKLEVLATITREDLITFVKQFIKGSHLKIMVLGNLTKEECLALPNRLASLEGRVPVPTSDIIKSRRICLEQGKIYLRQQIFIDTDQQNSVSLINFLAGSNTNKKATASVIILMTKIHEYLFDEIRTKQQLGYIVQAYNTTPSSQHTVGLLVQSNVKDASFVTGKVLESLPVFKQKLESISESDFKALNEATQKLILQKCQNVRIQAKQFYKLMTEHNGNYKYDVEIANVMNSLKLQDIVEFYNNIILDREKRRMAIFELNAEKDKDLPRQSNIEGDVVNLSDDYIHFRLSNPLFPATC